MNSGVVISAVSAVLVAIIGTLLAVWVKRADTATRLTQANLKAASDDLALVHALKHDFWDLEGWAHEVEWRWSALQRQLRSSGVITEVLDLPPIPESRLAKLEKARDFEQAAQILRDEGTGDAHT